MGGGRCVRLTRSARAVAHGAVPAVFLERYLEKSEMRLEKLLDKLESEKKKT